MANTILEQSRKSRLPTGGEPAFTEKPAWKSVGGDWRRLFGSFRDLGYSIEWHDFTAKRDFDWAQSFHPGSLEICLNMTGRGEVRAGNQVLEFDEATAGFYLQNEACLRAIRRGGERHQFLTVELSWSFLERHFLPSESGLHPLLSDWRANPTRQTAAVSQPLRLTSEQQHMMMNLRRPPVYAAAQRLWYQAKALEVAATLLYQPLPEEELFCQRQKWLSQERVRKVVEILKESLTEPPPLEEIGRRVGCSHFYLSRLFTQEMGKTISAYLRDLRMERAAEYLRQGKMNVTEAALAVGYSSLSHFSTAFCETFGCCPGLYPLATPTQRASKRSRP